MLRYFHATRKSRQPLIPIKQYINFGILLALLFACQEDPSKLGLEFLQDSDIPNVRLTDTLTTEAYTIEPERLVTTGQYNMPIGSYVDPVFGCVKAEILAQFAYSSYVDFGDDPVCDSLIIELFCSGSYGNHDFTSKIDVYELTSDLVDSIDYYKNEYNLLRAEGCSWTMQDSIITCTYLFHNVSSKIGQSFRWTYSFKGDTLLANILNDNNEIELSLSSIKME